MTAQDVLKTVALMPREDMLQIQEGITELIARTFSPEEVAEIGEALAESEAEIARGETLSHDEMKKHFGLS
jgi:hypothetical protein